MYLLDSEITCVLHMDECQGGKSLFSLVTPKVSIDTRRAEADPLHHTALNGRIAKSGRSLLTLGILREFKLLGNLPENRVFLNWVSIAICSSIVKSFHQLCCHQHITSVHPEYFQLLMVGQELREEPLNQAGLLDMLGKSSVWVGDYMVKKRSKTSQIKIFLDSWSLCVDIV